MARRIKRRPFAAPDSAPERLADALNQAIVDPNAEDRAFQAYRYWVLGFTFREIAQKCGYGSHTTAMRAVKRARTQIVIRDNRELVARQGDRIEHAVRVVVQAIETWPAQDKLWAVDRLVPLLKRESELMGLDTPREVAPAGPPQVKIIRQGGMLALPPVVDRQGGVNDPLGS